jgi:hypothetical protein
MASKTTRTEKRRKQKLKNRGKTRKRQARTHGSTPSKAKLFGDEK